MISYDEMCQHPEVFRDLTGMTRSEFDSLALQFAQAEQSARTTSQTTTEGKTRRRAGGAGRPHDNDAATRLLMALFWLRVYPTYAVLGFFFGLHKRNAQLNVRACLATLDTLDQFHYDLPKSDRPKNNSASKVMTEFPGVRIIVDAKEQRCHKPQGEQKQRPYYSGKKKCHTLKTQIVVNTVGEIESVSDTVPGGSTHDIRLLRESKILDELGEGEGGMGDKAYVGIDKSHPDVKVIVPHKSTKNRPLTEQQKEHNKKVAKARIVVEHTMAQLNRFTVLKQVCRAKKRERHGKVVRVVAKLVNRRLRVVPLRKAAA